MVPPFETWHASRFLPTACPKCRVQFDDPARVANWAAGEGNSYIEALSDCNRRFPLEHRAGGFLCCEACGNVTLRLLIEERLFATRVDAERACQEHGFTYITRSEAHAGDLAEFLNNVNGFESQMTEERRRILFEERVTADPLPALLEVLDTDWASVEERDDCTADRLDAIEAIEELRDPRAVTPLCELLADPDEFDEEARAAARALGAIGDRRAVATLLAALRNQDPGHRWEVAMKALVRFDDADIDAAVDEVQTYRRSRLPEPVNTPSAAELRESRAWTEPIL